MGQARSSTEEGYRIPEARGGTELVPVAGSHSGPIHLWLTDVGMRGTVRSNPKRKVE